jgi:hypothetical protein
MDKLKKALSGDDGDEEQGITTQVLNEEFIYSLMRQWSCVFYIQTTGACGLE